MPAANSIARASSGSRSSTRPSSCAAREPRLKTSNAGAPSSPRPDSSRHTRHVMADTINLADHALVAVSRPAIHALRAALLRDVGPSAAGALQEAGYAGGATVFEAFQLRASEYFHLAGWGTLEIGSLRDAVATVDTDDWGEADPDEHLDQPGCHFTTGMLADFF